MSTNCLLLPTKWCFCCISEIQSLTKFPCYYNCRERFFPVKSLVFPHIVEFPAACVNRRLATQFTHAAGNSTMCGNTNDFTGKNLS